MRKSSRAGFTLLEVLVATVIMGIAVTGLIVGLTQSAKNASRLAAYDRGVMLARTKMNDLILEADLPFEGSIEGDFPADQADGVPSGWKASMRPYDIPPNAGPGTLILQEIALEVWWEPLTGGRRTMHLETYRQAKIPIPAAPTVPAP
jgi:general secretion pathway protein I